jgi:hypothetical protein
MNKLIQPAKLALLATALPVFVLNAEPPTASPAKLPTTLAQVAGIIRTAEEAGAHLQTLTSRSLEQKPLSAKPRSSRFPNPTGC